MSDFADILGIINEALEGPARNYVLSNASLGTVIREGMAQELSGRSILGAYRAAGGTVANSTFWALRQEVLASQNAFQDKVALSTTPGDLVQPLVGGQAGKYRYDFRVYLSNDTASGLPARSSTRVTLHSWELDSNGAIEAMGQIVEGSGGNFYETGQALGFELVGIWQYQGK